jgi:hypothetical protein
VGGDESPAQADRYVGVGVAVHDDDLGVGSVREESHRIGRFRRRFAEERLGRPVAEAQPDRCPQVADGRQRHHPSDRDLGGGQPQREVSSRRVPREGDRSSRQAQSVQQRGQPSDRVAHVRARDRPAAPAPDAAVLRRRHEVPQRGQCCGHLPGVPTVVLQLPEPSVDEYDEPTRLRPRQVQVDHAVVVVGVAHGRVRQHDRHGSAGPVAIA